MINYKHPDTDYQLTEKEVNECLCMLVIFCDRNTQSNQANELKQQLEKMETAVHNGEFIN